LRRPKGFAGYYGAPGSGNLVIMPLLSDHPDLASRIEARKSAWKVAELAALLEYSPKTLYKMAKAGTIPNIRIRGGLRFDPVHTAEWLRARTIRMGYGQKKAA